MTRTTLHAALAIALFGTLALAGCKRNAEPAVDTTPPPVATTPAPAPAPTTPHTMGVNTVDLGNAVGADNRVTAPLSTFAKSDTIHASVATDGAAPSNLTAKWSFQDGQVIDTQDKTVAAGPQVTDFSGTKPDGWPLGKYKLEVMADGMVVQTREFEVK